MPSIKALDTNTVHRICSGQVVISLANAVKELVENSLDAGAKNIEIRLKEFGSESIEVIDDGPGVDESEFETITRKYYTSKIEAYDDLESLHTFGFRGEALNSLCALSHLTIITRTQATLNAHRIEYEQSGSIKTKKPCARSIGTSVILENLFYSLPVRHKEFVKNIKKEYNKLLTLIQSYCLISDGVKFTCFNTVSGKCTKLMSTNSKNTLQDNIIEIFGIHARNNLLKFEQLKFESIPEEIRNEFKIENPKPDEENLFQIEGFVSNYKCNLGRSSQDRQYLYINKRPCENSRLVKLINETYRHHNQTQYPMFILNISLCSKFIDVNVTPDKLKIFIKNENVLLAIFKSSLKSMYTEVEEEKKPVDESETESTGQKMYNFQFYKQTNEMTKEGKENSEPAVCTKKRVMRDSESDEMMEDEETAASAKATKKNKTDDFELCPKYKQTTLKSVVRVNDDDDEDADRAVLIKTIEKSNSKVATAAAEAAKVPNVLFQNNIGSNIQLPKSSHIEEATKSQKKLFDLNDSLSARLDLHFNKEFNADDSPHEEKMMDNLKKLGYSKYQSPSDHDLHVYESEAEQASQEKLKLPKKTVNRRKLSGSSSDDEEPVFEKPRLQPVTVPDSDSEVEPVSLKQSKPAVAKQISPKTDFMKNRKVKEINVSFSKFADEYRKKAARKNDELEQKSLSIKFKPKSFDSKEAESELDRYIRKEDFKTMNVCGQFNKGFIVTKLENDLFIVDQHAADEIYNFEQLQITNKIEKQRLLQPHFLELSPSAELLLIENELLLEKAGYEMQVAKSRKSGNRIMLTSVPASKKSRGFFDSSDIDELLFILNENNISICNDSAENLDNISKLHKIKPSSLRAMYASKACRKSVMIGDSLNKCEMKRIVTHLSEIIKPWNCPHGRPTLRHLINLDILKTISQE